MELSETSKKCYNNITEIFLHITPKSPTKRLLVPFYNKIKHDFPMQERHFKSAAANGFIDLVFNLNYLILKFFQYLL